MLSRLYLGNGLGLKRRRSETVCVRIYYCKERRIIMVYGRDALGRIIRRLP